MQEKRKLNARDISCAAVIISKMSMVGVCRNKFLTLCSKIPMIQWLTHPGSSFYRDRFECMREKETILGGGEGKTNLRGRDSVEMNRPSEN